jgi:hypothetical protein
MQTPHGAGLELELAIGFSVDMNGNLADRAIRRLVLTAAWGTCVAALLLAAPHFASAQEAEATPTLAPAAEPEGASAPAAAEAAVIDPAKLEKLVTDLDDDRYAIREAAQKELALLGAPALDAVAEAAVKGSLESSTRALNVLLGWADSKDNTLSLAALERITQLEARPVEAAMANERLAVVREAAAVEAIKSLGGRFDYDRAAQIMGGGNPSMQVIIGPRWKGGVEGLKHIANVRSVSTLCLHSAPLGDDAVAALAGLGHLRRIEMFGTEITPEGVNKLEPQLPNTQLDLRGGARLGIAGLVIERVVPDSPAAKGGLQPNDKVLEFAGQAIDDTNGKGFEQLTQLIAKCKPGDTVTVKVQRATETLDKSVTFDRWGDDERTMMGSPELQQRFVPVQVQGGGQIIIRNAPLLPIQPVPAQQQEQRR